jgi:two-component system, chemotaxis family, CheB/CheR fusion protein
MSGAPHGDTIDGFLEFLRVERGFDFTGYKRPSLLRRIERRMTEVGVGSVGEYQEYLELHPEEFPVLFDTILIKVTEFFRDPAAWELLRERVIAPLAERVAAGESLRVWSAGCATGEEAYTLAMILAEAVGEVAFATQVKLYATDIDDDALARARSATFSGRQLGSLDEERRARFFDATGSSYVFKANLRRSMIFGRHDLTRDAPIARLDLLCCRNTLMYFDAELQGRVVARFHYALNDEGFLFLGRAETLLSHQDLFTPLETRHRVFAKVPLDPGRQVSPAIELLGRPDAGTAIPILTSAAAASPASQFVVDVDGVLVGANAAARAQFGISVTDIGRAFSDLPVSFRPLALRPLIETVYAEGTAQVREAVPRELVSGEVRHVDVTVTPLFNDAGEPLGVSIVFVDVTEMVRLRAELARSADELRDANVALQASNEELETANEELQSSNEELETTNEELQSSNEELETTNEELQSSNEELVTMNAELQHQTLELDRSSGLLDSVLASLASVVIAVDQAGHVELWNDAAKAMFGLDPSEVVGQVFADIDSGFPVADLADAVAESIGGTRQDLTVDAHDRRGHPIRCRVQITPLVLDRRELHGAVLVVTTTEA